jgi:hypothetical protein
MPPSNPNPGAHDKNTTLLGEKVKKSQAFLSPLATWPRGSHPMVGRWFVVGVALFLLLLPIRGHHTFTLYAISCKKKTLCQSAMNSIYYVLRATAC